MGPFVDKLCMVYVHYRELQGGRNVGRKSSQNEGQRERERDVFNAIGSARRSSLPGGMWRARDYPAIPAISIYKAAALSERLVQQQPTFLHPNCAIIH